MSTDLLLAIGDRYMAIDVRRCVRCGLDHPGLGFHKLLQPSIHQDGTAWTHWAWCPTTGEPIMLLVREKAA